MLKDITLGQYFPGNTVIHMLDPRAKLIITFIYIILLFVAQHAVSYGIMLAFLATSIIISRIRLANIFRGIKPLLIIIFITALLNLFYTKGEIVVQFWIFKISYEGIRSAVLMILRITMLIAGTFLLTYTSSPISLTDGIESLLNPLKKIKLPVHELAMMMSIALRFIPTLIEETDKIMSAQKARGADFETGSLLKRAKALVPILIPLFVSAFRRADELAVAMESRCYHGGEGRTRMYPLRMEKRDVIALIIAALLLGGVITLVVFGL